MVGAVDLSHGPNCRGVSTVSQGVDLARPALDTLPLNVAVLDPDGEILLTNRAWKEFAVTEGDVEEPDAIGRNYLAATDETGDEYARLAAEGIEAVLSGEEDLYTLEYPCHSPSERRWFLMRVSPIPMGGGRSTGPGGGMAGGTGATNGGTRTGDGERGAVVAHVDITERKLAELAADERASQLEHVLDRVNGLVGDVTASVVHARSRGEAEAAACERFVDTEPYRFAWVGRPDLRKDRLVVHEWAGDAPAGFEEQAVSLEADDPTVRAYETGEVQMVEDLAGVATAWDPRAEWDAVALAAVPLTYRSKTYGVLTAYVGETALFDERERAVLGALGRTLATAIHALTTGRILSSASVIEVELAISDPEDYLAALTAGTDLTLTYEDSLVEDDGQMLVYLTVEGGDADVVRDRTTSHDCVDAVRVLTESPDRMLVELAVSDSIVGDVADHDGVTWSLAGADGSLSLTAAFPDEEAARTAFEHLRDRFESVELRGYRERERETDTTAGFSRTVESSLTDRQLTALRTAYFSGYFDWPRPVSGDEVADSMDITRATFHQHLREAERKLAAAFFEGSVPD